MRNDPDKAAKFQAKLAALKEEFALRQTKMIAEYHEVWTLFSKASPGDAAWDEGLEKLIFVSHGLAGSSGTFGFAEISEVANQIETGLRALRDKGADEDLLKDLGQLSARLKD